MRITQEHVDALYAADVVDQEGERIGGVGQVYLDDTSGVPAWVTVRTGLFGTSETFAPLGSAELADGQIRVPYEKDFVKDAPSIDADRRLDEAQQEELYRYYSLRSGDLAQHAGTLEDPVAPPEAEAGSDWVRSDQVRLRRHAGRD